MDFEDLLELVDDCEGRESRLLSWGVSDPRLSETELDEILAARGLETSSREEVIWRLLREQLLVASKYKGATIYRTRSAEIVRLATRLRQWFGARGEDVRIGDSAEARKIDQDAAASWPEAPSLIGDFRFLAGPRARPARRIEAIDFSKELSASDLGRYAPAIRSLLGQRVLSGFQARATKSLLAPSARFDRGSVVTAGTGAGKTLAFYLPVLAKLLIDGQSTCGPTVLAIYPRNELLKDQIQTALREARQAHKVAPGAGKIRIGALFGDVPNNWADARRSAYRGWHGKRGAGLTCPFLRCPECDSALRLEDESTDRLDCVSPTCDGTVAGDEVAFTREAMKKHPPTMLFVSGEMLDRALRSPSLRKIVGLGSESIRFVLLDEIHTYEGISGAQYALTLQRWRAQVRSRGIHWVGLSATLNQPVAFFANLSQISPERIVHVAPKGDEMEHVGRQYTLLLQGDAAGQTALLSASIQALMLLSRTAVLSAGGIHENALDVPIAEAQETVFGTRSFAFTDKLDIIRRLVDDLRDAERQKLAWLRQSLSEDGGHAASEDLERDVAGQSWKLAEGLGQDLSRSLEVSEVSSSNRGKAAEGDVVVATSALEVGVDDPRVGVVLQHKAPRQWSSYLQRMGRAGRDIQMRPWAVTVLSDFARDRLAFQNYEDFFSPSVRTVHLPTGNVHVLKMQAAAALLDMLAERVGWGPSLEGIHRHSWKPEELRRWRDALVDLTKDIDVLAKRLGKRLGIDSQSRQMHDVLWRSPRSILLEFVPALRRQIKGGGASEEQERGPFIRFLPQALFKSLNIPEVLLNVQNKRDLEGLPIEVALREFAPFHANKRLASRGETGHWLALSRDQLTSVSDGVEEMPIEALGQFAFDGDVVKLDGSTIEVWRPHRLYLSTLPSGDSSARSLDRSRGEYVWDSDFICDDAPSQYLMPGGLGLSKCVARISVFTHASGCPLTVYRFSEYATAEIPSISGDVTRRRFSFVKRDGESASRAAIGFSMEVDAVIVEFGLPEELAEYWGSLDYAALPSVRRRFFEYLVHREVDGHWNRFQIDWALECFFGMLADLVLNSTRKGSDCIRTLFSNTRGFDARLERVLAVLFPDSAEDSRVSEKMVRTRQDILELLQDRDFRTILQQCSSVLEDSDCGGEWSNDYQTWMASRCARALAGAFRSSCQELLPEIDESSTHADVTWDDEAYITGRIYLTESEPGGVGVCSAIQQLLEQDMDRFASLWDAKLAESETERRESDLERLASRFAVDEAWQSKAAAYRESASVATQEGNAEAIRQAVIAEGIPPSHGLISAVFNRLLAPGSSGALDRIWGDLFQLREQLEQRLGIELPARAIAFASCCSQEIVERMAKFEPWSQHANIGTREAFQRLAGLQWRRASEHRDEELDYYSPFSESLGVDASALRSLRPAVPRVDVEASGWVAQLEKRLNEATRVELFTPNGDLKSLAAAVRRLTVQDISYQMLRVYLEVESVRRSSSGWSVTVTVPGVLL